MSKVSRHFKCERSTDPRRSLALEMKAEVRVHDEARQARRGARRRARQSEGQGKGQQGRGNKGKARNEKRTQSKGRRVAAIVRAEMWGGEERRPPPPLFLGTGVVPLTMPRPALK